MKLLQAIKNDPQLLKAFSNAAGDMFMERSPYQSRAVDSAMDTAYITTSTTEDREAASMFRLSSCSPRRPILAMLLRKAPEIEYTPSEHFVFDTMMQLVKDINATEG